MIAAGGVTEAVSPAAVLVVGSNERTLVAKKPKGWNAFNKLAKRTECGDGWKTTGPSWRDGNE